MSVTSVINAFQTEPFDAIKVSERIAGRGKYAGKTAEDLRAEWDATRDRGTRMHSLLERYVNLKEALSDAQQTLNIFEEELENISRPDIVCPRFYDCRRFVQEPVCEVHKVQRELFRPEDLPETLKDIGDFIVPYLEGRALKKDEEAIVKQKEADPAFVRAMSDFCCENRLLLVEIPRFNAGAFDGMVRGADRLQLVGTGPFADIVNDVLSTWVTATRYEMLAPIVRDFQSRYAQLLASTEAPAVKVVRRNAKKQKTEP